MSSNFKIDNIEFIRLRENYFSLYNSLSNVLMSKIGLHTLSWLDNNLLRSTYKKKGSLGVFSIGHALILKSIKCLLNFFESKNGEWPKDFKSH